MLPREIQKLVIQIYSNFHEEKRQQVKQEPEVFLVSLLQAIQKELPDISAMLESTVEKGGYEENRQEAIRYLRRSRKNSHKQSLQKAAH